MKSTTIVDISIDKGFSKSETNGWTKEDYDLEIIPCNMCGGKIKPDVSCWHINDLELYMFFDICLECAHTEKEAIKFAEILISLKKL